MAAQILGVKVNFSAWSLAELDRFTTYLFYYQTGWKVDMMSLPKYRWQHRQQGLQLITNYCYSSGSPLGMIMSTNMTCLMV